MAVVVKDQISFAQTNGSETYLQFYFEMKSATDYAASVPTYKQNYPYGHFWNIKLQIWDYLSQYQCTYFHNYYSSAIYLDRSLILVKLREYIYFVAKQPVENLVLIYQNRSSILSDLPFKTSVQFSSDQSYLFLQNNLLRRCTLRHDGTQKVAYILPLTRKLIKIYYYEMLPSYMATPSESRAPVYFREEQISEDAVQYATADSDFVLICDLAPYLGFSNYFGLKNSILVNEGQDWNNSFTINKFAMLYLRYGEMYYKAEILQLFGVPPPLQTNPDLKTAQTSITGAFNAFISSKKYSYYLEEQYKVFENLSIKAIASLTNSAQPNQMRLGSNMMPGTFGVCYTQKTVSNEESDEDEEDEDGEDEDGEEGSSCGSGEHNGVIRRRTERKMPIKAQVALPSRWPNTMAGAGFGGGMFQYFPGTK